MTNKKYIFFIDIDETLIPTGQTEIPTDIVEEIERLKKLGYIFVISTGRSLNSTLVIKHIEVFEYISALMGGCIYQTSSKEILDKGQSMPREQIKKLVDILNKQNIEWSYKDEIYEKTIFHDSQFFRSTADCKYVSLSEFYSDLENNKVMQFLFVQHLPKTILKDFPDLNFFEMQQGYTDVSLKDATKARCIKFFKNKYPNLTTVSIGDSFNDVPMFETTDISIAMGNSCDLIKQKTTFVTKDINNGGLIYAFRNILKI